MFVDVPRGRRVARAGAARTRSCRRRSSSGCASMVLGAAAAARGRAGAGGLGRASEAMTSADATPIEPYQAKDYKSELQADLVPGLRRLRRRAGDLPRARGRRPAAARDRVRLGHRLLEPHPRLHDGVRLQQRPRPRAADRAGHQAREPGAARARGRRRRRRLLDRRRPRGARHPPQHGPHLHRDGQPDLRADQGAAVARPRRAGCKTASSTLGQPRGSR